MEYDNSGRASHRYGNTGPGVALNIVSVLGITATFLLLLNRLFWRWKKDTFGFDDFLLVVSWILLLALGIVSMKAVDYGYGRKQSTLTQMEASDAERLFYVYQIIYKLTINTCKLSILILYLRCFGAKSWFGYVTKALLFVVTIYTFSILMANIFICSPVSLYWNTKLSGEAGAAIRKSHCINVLAYWYASSLYNILSESVMLLSVLIRVWTLPSSHSQSPNNNFQFRQKVNLTIVLGLGVFTVATAILRMTTLSRTAMTLDKTGGTLTSTIWSSIEAGLGIAVANLPMVRQLLRWRGWYGGFWFSSTAGKSREHSRQRGSRSGGHPGFPEVNQNENVDNLRTPSDGQHIRLQSGFGRGIAAREQRACDIEAQSPTSQQIEIESLSVDVSPSRNTKDSAGARGSKSLSGSISGATLKGRSDSNAPSFTSTMSPTVPMPMIKISIEPSSISLPPAIATPCHRDGHNR